MRSPLLSTTKRSGFVFALAVALLVGAACSGSETEPAPDASAQPSSDTAVEADQQSAPEDASDAVTSDIQNAELPGPSPDASGPEDSGTAPEDSAGACPEGSPCDDNDPCTSDDLCQADGSCQGSAYSCDDGLSCTQDSCDGAGGCEQALDASSCLIDGACYADGDTLTGNNCLYCWSESFSTAWSTNDDAPCSDDDACTVDDRCLGGSCVAGEALECDDGDACNGEESCDPSVGCQSSDPPACVEDENPCTVSSCDASEGCVQIPQDDLLCEDGNPCTDFDTCTDGVCEGTPHECEDGPFCAIGCEGDKQLWCFAGELAEEDCSALGATCGESVMGTFECVCNDEFTAVCADETTVTMCSDNGLVELSDCAVAGAECIESDGQGACTCDPDTHAAVCLDGFSSATCAEDGSVKRFDCRDIGGICGVDNAGDAVCACGDSFASTCSPEGHWTYCGLDEVVVEADCSAWGLNCQTNGETAGCGCGDDFTDTCADEQRLVTCGEEGMTVLANCSELGGSCGLNDAGQSACVGPGCPDIPESKLCDGNVLVSCVDGFRVESDCGATGEVCTLDTELGVYTCAASQSDCGDLTVEGECVGNVARWCSEEGQPVQFDCGAWGASCGHTGEFIWCLCDESFEKGCQGEDKLLVCNDAGYVASSNCAEQGASCKMGDFEAYACVGNSCEGETWLGRCEDDTIVWCENLLVKGIDCASQGKTCGYDLENHFFNCVDEVQNCGEVTSTGQCYQSYLERCEEDGSLSAVDCAESERECGYSEAIDAWACLGCMDVPDTGKCDGETIQWCEDQLISSLDCSAHDSSCGDDGMGGQWCVCDPSTHQATCLGDVLLSCHPGYEVLDLEDCASLDATCAIDGEGVAYCAGSGCGEVTEQGQCEGSTLTYCEDDIVYTVECADQDNICGLDDQEALYTCLPDTGDCGDVSAEGSCEGNSYVYCNNNAGYAQVTTIDCTTLQKQCGQSDDGDWGCIDPPPGCGEVTEAGSCDGNLLTYCLDDQVVLVDCGSQGKDCGESGEYFDCVSAAAGSCGEVTFFGSCESETLSYCQSDTVKTIDCGAEDMVCADDGILGMNCLLPETAGACAPECPTGFVCTGGSCHANGSQAREWTYLVYIAGDNDLAPAALSDLDEMEQVGSSEDLAIAVQTEFSSDPAYGIPEHLHDETFRYLVGYDETWNVLDEERLLAGAIGNKNMGDPAELSDFIRWGVQTYPAKHYALVVWDHGAGWMGGFHDDTSGDKLSMAEIRSGIKDAGIFLDMIDFDACLMSMYEVAIELHDLVGLIVAAEEVEPGCGNPYHLYLDRLSEDPTMSTATFGEHIVNDFLDYYKDAENLCGIKDVTKSVLDVSKALSFHEKVSALANGLRANMHDHRPAILEALSATQNFHYTFFRDVKDFADRIAASTLPASVRETAEILSEAVGPEDGLVTVNGVFQQDGSDELTKAHGVSIMAPDAADAEAYPHVLTDYLETLTYRQRQSAWSLFLQELVGFPEAIPAVSPNGQVQLRWYADLAQTIDADSDLTLYVVEPSGQIYAAYASTSTPNGLFSAESTVAGSAVESYTFAESVSGGVYNFIVVYEADGTAQSQVFPQVSINLENVDGYPQTLNRLDGVGEPMPMSLNNPFPDFIETIITSSLSEEQWTDIWTNAYSNVWMIPPLELNANP